MRRCIVLWFLSLYDWPLIWHGLQYSSVYIPNLGLIDIITLWVAVAAMVDKNHILGISASSCDAVLIQP